ncbi:MAG: copper-containing nitrite reductase [Candidatus Spechtbacterales bacterium]
MGKERVLRIGLIVSVLALFLTLVACAGGANTQEGRRALLLTPKAELRSEQGQWSHAPNVPAPITRKEQRRVIVEWETREVVQEIAPGVQYAAWTFEGSVPGPVLRVREGDLVEFHLKNNVASNHPHNIDFHFATGPGGGAKATLVAPGEEAVIEVRAVSPGLYMYHCAAPDIPTHIANGMYGFVLVEPAEGLPKVDREFYVVQSEFYPMKTESGISTLDMTALDAEHPSYVVFNGAVGSLTGDNSPKVKVGDTVRVWFGNAGPQLSSSFHIIGETFDRVFLGGRSSPAFDPQVVGVPASGGVAVDFKIDVPGAYILVDHAIARAIHKGAVGVIIAEGSENHEIFEAKGLVKKNPDFVHDHRDDGHGSQNGTEVRILLGASNYDEDLSNDYSPNVIAVSVGTTVTWMNDDNTVHTVTAKDGGFDSGLFSKGQSFSYTFTKAGEYEYYCLPHPWMKGKIVVNP